MTEPVPHRLITTRSEFHDALRDAFAELASADCREVLIADETFGDWPLGERAVVEHLTRWAHAHRRMTLLARNFDELARRHPRFVEWRRTYAHLVDCRALEDAGPGEIPVVLLASGLLVVRLVDPVHHRGSLSHELGDAIPVREQIEALLQRSTPSFPASTLGL